jgi:endonuclease/exonuclease/phosphatase (EEP) superfamily protein YafD
MGCVIVNVGAWVLAVLLLAWTAVRLVGEERGTPLVQLMAFTPYVAVLAVLVTVAVAATGRLAAAGACAVAAVALVGGVVRRVLPTGRPDAAAPAVTLRVMTANVLIGRADAADLVRQVKIEEVDVLAVQELTFDCLDGLDEAGIGELLPHRIANPTKRWEGSAVFSRHPISDTAIRPLGTGRHTQAAATVTVPGGPAVRVESAHPCAPRRGYTGEWRAGLATQPAAPDGGLPRILMGDFNATLDHGSLRRLLATGYRDAAAERGAGLVPTWPFLRYRVPPVTLDHILVSEPITVASVAVRPILGSDHRAVVAEVRLPS